MKTKSSPEIGFLRLRDVIGDKDKPGIIPVSRSSRAEGIAKGRYPRPVKLGERMSAWRIDELNRQWLYLADQYWYLGTWADNPLVGGSPSGHYAIPPGATILFVTFQLLTVIFGDGPVDY